MKTAVAYTTISVSNMDAALAYYEGIIGMDTKADEFIEGTAIDNLYGLRGVKARRVKMQLPVGSEIHLVQHLEHKGRAVASELRQFDIGIIHLDIASKQIDQLYESLQKQGVKIQCSIQTNERQSNRCFSFLGPDGVRLETHEWSVNHSWIPNVNGKRHFYAFVHTALSIADQSSTLGLYRDLLELKVIRESHLQGDRFDKMDGLEGGIAKNCVVRGVNGSEIQFIWHYAGQHKGEGKPVAENLRQSDLGIVNIGLKTDAIEELYKRLVDAGVTLNCGIQVTGDRSRAFSFRDPDGNLLIAHD